MYSPYNMWSAAYRISRLLLVFALLCPNSISKVFAEGNTQSETKSQKMITDEEKLEIARIEYQSGLADFKAKRYRDALKRFNRVYRLQPHPNLVYNMARSFEELKEYRNAAEYYQKYLEIAPNTKDRAQVEMTINTMNKLAQDHSTKSTDTADHLLTKRVGWATAAMGTILVVGGSIFGARALNRNDQLKQFGEGDSIQRFNTIYDERDQAALLSDIFTISGVALGSLGLYFALRPVKQNTSDTSVSLSFSGQGLSIQGAF